VGRADGCHLGEVEALETEAELALRLQRARQDRGEQRLQRQRVIGRDEMQRRAHQPGAHGCPIDQQPIQLSGIEAFDPRPQAHEGVLRLLGLEADEIGEHPSHGSPIPVEQALPSKQGSVQSPLVEDRRRHPRMIGHPEHRRRPGSACAAAVGPQMRWAMMRP
jgi:hypothetical protein